MTNIDTVSASKHWTKNGKDERHYLAKIGYVAITDDVGDGKNISLLGDEEGNYETILTPLAAKYLIARLFSALQELGCDKSIIEAFDEGLNEK